MPDIRREIGVGDLTYIAQINAKSDFDGRFVAMIRYRLDERRHVVEAHHWTPERQWVSFTPGGAYPPIRIPSIHWPESAYELLRHVGEPDAAEVLKEAIDAAVKATVATTGS